MNELLETAIKAAIDAGKEILDVYETGDFGVEAKSDDSPLTIADKKAHQAIVKCLDDTDIPVLSEEGKHADFDSRKDWRKLWIVDPLDGTKEFIKKNGEFTVNIALIENGSPIAGVVYVPVKNWLYFSTGEESFKVESKVSGEEGLSQLRSMGTKLPQRHSGDAFVIVASRSHKSQETENFIEELKKEHGDVELTSMGSSLKICLVAEGKADIYPRFAPTMEWDTAAGHAIAKGAGRELYDHSTGDPMKYNREELLNNWFIVK